MNSFINKSSFNIFLDITQNLGCDFRVFHTVMISDALIEEIDMNKSPMVIIDIKGNQNFCAFTDINLKGFI